jgi:cation:H+ antiporter
VALAGGSYWVVVGATEIARLAGVSELIIGLTVVSAGTGLPELVTSVVAALRKETEVAVGNVIGSSIANILLVLGVLGVAVPNGTEVAPSVVRFDLPVMIATAVVCLPVFLTGFRIERWEGFLLVGYYVAYAAYLLLDATGHDALSGFGTAMIAFVIPLTIVTLAATSVRSLRSSCAPRSATSCILRWSAGRRKSRAGVPERGMS